MPVRPGQTPPATDTARAAAVMLFCAGKEEGKLVSGRARRGRGRRWGEEWRGSPLMTILHTLTLSSSRPGTNLQGQRRLAYCRRCLNCSAEQQAA